MTYYTEGMELEVVSEQLRGAVNDVVVCRNRLAGTGMLYTLLVVHDRSCARNLLTIMENSDRGGESPCLRWFSQNEDMIFLFTYREERRFSSFYRGQIVRPETAEQIGINLVMECLATGLPWPLLHLVLEQDQVQLTRDNNIYFTVALDLQELDMDCTEKQCVKSCVKLILELLSAPAAGSRRRRRGGQLKSFELIWKKNLKNNYRVFSELYQDIRLSALPTEKMGVKSQARILWRQQKDRLFKFLLALCVVLLVLAAAILVTQLIFGEVPWLRLFENTFDVIGTENLHGRGGQ